MSRWEKMRAGLHLPDPEATHSTGIWIGRTVAPNQVITVSGNLGDGKTTLCKGIAEGWGVASSVKSPTYNYFLTYSSPRGLLLHLDAYRLSSAADYESLLIEELLEEPWLLLVEWPEKIAAALPSPILSLRITEAPENTRTLQLLTHTASPASP